MPNKNALVLVRRMREFKCVTRQAERENFQNVRRERADWRSKCSKRSIHCDRICTSTGIGESSRIFQIWNERRTSILPKEEELAGVGGTPPPPPPSGENQRFSPLIKGGSRGESPRHRRTMRIRHAVALSRMRMSHMRVRIAVALSRMRVRIACTWSRMR
jgi:hypothetical protein